MRQNWDFLPLCTICTKMGSQSTITAVSKSWSSISSQSSSIRSDWSISYYRNDSDQDSVESISSTLMIALRESLFTSRYRDKQNEGLLKTNWKVNQLFLSPVIVFENHRKSLIQHCKLRFILSGQKLIKNAKNDSF